MYPEWYWNTEVQKAMLPFILNREFYSAKPKHYKQGQKLGKLHSVTCTKDLNFAFGFEDINKNEFNFFTSVAYFNNGIPTTNISKWFDNYTHSISAYDFFLDIDSMSHKEFNYCFISAKIVKEFFDSLSVPYYLRFSGKGFHFVIPSSYFGFELFYAGAKVYSVYQRIADYLKNNYTELIDSKIYESHRKIKVPYSLALYENITYVCTPINSNYQFYNFNLDNYTPEVILSKIKGRNQNLFNPQGNVTKLLEVV